MYTELLFQLEQLDNNCACTYLKPCALPYDPACYDNGLPTFGSLKI